MNYTGNSCIACYFGWFFSTELIAIHSEISFSIKDTCDSCFGRNLARFLRRQHNYTEYLLEQPVCWASAYDAYSFWNYRREPICKCPLLWLANISAYEMSNNSIEHCVVNVGISPQSIEHGHVFCLNKSALHSDSAQNPTHFSTLSHISGIVTSFVPQVSSSWPRSAPFSTCEGSKSAPGAWKQMNEALMLSSRWASVSAAAARLKQCVGKVGQSLSFLQGTRKKKKNLLPSPPSSYDWDVKSFANLSNLFSSKCEFLQTRHKWKDSVIQDI